MLGRDLDGDSGQRGIWTERSGQRNEDNRNLEKGMWERDLDGDSGQRDIWTERSGQRNEDNRDLGCGKGIWTEILDKEVSGQRDLDKGMRTKGI